MGMGRLFLLTAAISLFYYITHIVMRMSGFLLLQAGQDFRIALCTVGMAGAFRKIAHQFGSQTAIFVAVRFRLLQSAADGILIAGFPMAVACILRKRA